MDPKSMMRLIGRGKKAEPEEDSDDDESGSLVAAKAVLAAIKSGDATKLDEALQSHYTLCSHDED